MTGERLKEMAFILGEDIVDFFTGRGQHAQKNTCCSTMRRMALETKNKHDILWRGLINRCTLDNLEDVIDSMLSDGRLNWGRVVTIYTLGGMVAQRHGEPSRVSRLIGFYVYTKAGPWIRDNGGWRNFIQAFANSPGNSLCDLCRKVFGVLLWIYQHI